LFSGEVVDALLLVKERKTLGVSDEVFMQALQKKLHIDRTSILLLHHVYYAHLCLNADVSPKPLKILRQGILHHVCF
jgi:hypothetical protein